MATPAHLELLLYQTLTPKGRRLIKAAIRSDASPHTLAELDIWWKQVFVSASSFAYLQANMFMLQKFLLNALLADYLDQPYKPPRIVEDLCQIVLEEQRSGPQVTGDITLRQPAEQLDLDPVHITKRLLRLGNSHKRNDHTVVVRDSQSSCDQQNLDDLLSDDRKLLDSLHVQGAVGEEDFQRLQQSLKKIKRGSVTESKRSWLSWL